LKGRGGETGATRASDRPENESAGRNKRSRVMDDGIKALTAPGLTADRPANCPPPRSAGFCFKPSFPALPGPGNGVSSTSSQAPPHQPYSRGVISLPTSIQSSSAACLPYYDVTRMQMLAAAAAGDLWKARTAAAAAAAMTGVCPALTPPISMIWPPPTSPGSSEFCRSRNALEQFLAMSSPVCGLGVHYQRALSTFEDIKSVSEGGHNYRPGRASPLPQVLLELHTGPNFGTQRDPHKS